jgi:hypothetical protein
LRWLVAYPVLLALLLHWGVPVLADALAALPPDELTWRPMLVIGIGTP